MEDKSTYLKFFILLVGLPASGKSTLSKALKSALGDLAFIIEFDQIELSLSGGGIFDPNVWHQAREQAFNIAKENNSKFVILDDNFSHRSMRKIYYQLARDTGCSYLELHLPLDIEEAVTRNSQRVKPVPEEVIRTMKIEDSAYSEHSVTLTDITLVELVPILQVPRVPKPLLPILIEEQQFMDKVDQALKKSFSTFMASSISNKARGKELSDKRSQFYQLIKTALNDKGCNDGNVREIIEAFKEGETNETQVISQICEMFIKSLK